MAATKEILATLKLDSKDFSSKIGDNTKSVLKMTATISAVTVAVAAAVKMTADYMDATTKAARAAGASVTDYSALVHAANLSGVETGNLGKALRALAKPSEETQEKLQKLGISMREEFRRGRWLQGPTANGETINEGFGHGGWDTFAGFSFVLGALLSVN